MNIPLRVFRGLLEFSLDEAKKKRLRKIAATSAWARAPTKNRKPSSLIFVLYFSMNGWMYFAECTTYNPFFFCRPSISAATSNSHQHLCIHPRNCFQTSLADAETLRICNGNRVCKSCKFLLLLFVYPEWFFRHTRKKKKKKDKNKKSGDVQRRLLLRRGCVYCVCDEWPALWFGSDPTHFTKGPATRASLSPLHLSFFFIKKNKAIVLCVRRGWFFFFLFLFLTTCTSTKTPGPVGHIWTPGQANSQQARASACFALLLMNAGFFSYLIHSREVKA